MIILYIVILVHRLHQVLGQATESSDGQTVTAPENLLEATDIPQGDVDEALVIDAGKYVPISFNYINAQYHKEKNENYQDRCIDDYTKCLISQSAPTPVCAYHNDYFQQKGYRNLNSYCDIYFDNCRRGYRFWRIFDYGRCTYNPRSPYMPTIQHTRRKKLSLNDFILKTFKLNQHQN